MIGEKICDWFIRELPSLTAWIGGMSDWQAVAFAIGLLLVAYAMYVAAYNLYLTWCGVDFSDNEPFQDWMDWDLYND